MRIFNQLTWAALLCLSVILCSTSSHAQYANTEGFETGWGIWNDGGTDAHRYQGDKNLTGNFSIRLRDNSNRSSSVYTDQLPLQGLTTATISFQFVAESFEANEDFFLEYSADGGSTFQTIRNFRVSDQFQNNVVRNEIVRFTRNFTNNSVFRFRSDASGDGDLVYFDQVGLNVTNGSACAVAVETRNIQCDGQGTTTIDDDMFTVDVIVTGEKTSGTWTGTLGGQEGSGNFGQVRTYGPFRTNHGSTISGWFMDANIQNCAFDITVTAPRECSSVTTPPSTCTGQINGLAINFQGNMIENINGATFCNTDFEARDVTIRANVSGGHESLRFDITRPDGSQSNIENHLPYDSRNFWATQEGTYTITATLYSDANLGGAVCDSYTASFVVNSNHCGQTGGSNTNCNITVATSNIQCDGRGTQTIDDDIFTVDVTVDGTNTSGSWTGALGGLNATGLIGQRKTLGPFPTNHGSTISGWFMDRDNSNCAFDITVTAPRGCSTTANPPACTGQINGLAINFQGNLINNINGATFCSTEFAARDITIRADVSGAHESLRFNITRPDGSQTNNENHLPYDSRNFWANVEGTYTITATLYSDANLGGEICDTYTASFQVGSRFCAATVVNGGTLSGGPYTFCVDGTADNVSGISLRGNTGPNSQWIVTDENRNILGLPPMPSAVDFDAAGPGVCFFYHVSYTDITGLEAGANLDNLGGNFDLSNRIQVTRNQVDGGTLTGGPYTFVVDGTPDFVSGINLSGATGSNTGYIVTDDNGNILGLPPMPGVVDFDAAGVGVCYIYHVAYEDIGGLAAGNNISNLTGCFHLSNFVVVRREAPQQSCTGQINSLSLNFLGDLIDNIDGAVFCNTEFEISDVTVRAKVSGDHQSIRFEITRPDGTQANNTNNLPYESRPFWATPEGTYTITARLYSGINLTGELCDTYTATFQVNSRYCISNFINGGSLIGGPYTFCVDGTPDNVSGIILGGNTGPNNQWIVTDENRNILGLPPMPSAVDFDAAGPGVCFFYHVSYSDITGLEAGANLDNLSGNFDLSNRVQITRNQVDGGTLTGGPYTFVVDGTPDFVSGINLSGATGSNTGYIVTDDNGNILGLPPMPGVVDFDAAGVGVCYIYHVAYEDIGGLVAGNNIANLTGCFDLSNFVVVRREAPQQGCTGRIDGLVINFQGNQIENINGATFCNTDFTARDITITANVSGAHESLRFSITRPDGSQTNNENHLPYDSRNFWATAEGTYTITATLYSDANLGGTVCDSYTATFEVDSRHCQTGGGNNNGGTNTCAITVATSNIQCDGRGTQTIDDDLFTVDVTVNGSNTSGTWSGALGGQDSSGDIGQTRTFGPFPTNHGSTISGWFMDKNNSNCAFDITVTAPRDCSNSNSCFTLASYAGFESGWEGWNDGGSDAHRSNADPAPAGNYSIRLRDNSGSASSMYTNAMNLEGVSQCRVDFKYIASSMEDDEDFILEYSTNNGASYTQVRSWVKDRDFENGPEVRDGTATFGAPFTNSTRIRLRCDASGNADLIWIDEVSIYICGGNPFAGKIISDNGASETVDFAGKSSKPQVTNSTIEIETSKVATKQEELFLFPNPVSDRLNVGGINGQSYDVYSISGQRVMHTQTKGILDISQLQSGTYFIRTIDGQVSRFYKI